MNHEHKNKMDKVRSYPPAPRKPRGKKNKRKGNTGKGTQLDNHLGHVKMKSKYSSTCGACSKPIAVGNLIWWNPEAKYVIHDQCFDKYFA